MENGVINKKKIIPNIKGLIIRPIFWPSFIHALFKGASSWGAFKEIRIKAQLAKDNTYFMTFASPDNMKKTDKKAQMPANKKPKALFDAER